MVVTLETRTNPQFELVFRTSEQVDVLRITSSVESSRISSGLLAGETKWEGLPPLEEVVVLVEFQGEGVFVEVGQGSVLVPFPEEAWEGNSNTAWAGVEAISQVMVDGQDIFVGFLRGVVLVF